MPLTQLIEIQNNKAERDTTPLLHIYHELVGTKRISTEAVFCERYRYYRCYCYVMLLVVTVEAFQSGAGSSRQEQDCFEFPRIEINIV